MHPLVSIGAAAGSTMINQNRGYFKAMVGGNNSNSNNNERKTSIRGAGGLADAVRHELSTGELVLIKQDEYASEVIALSVLESIQYLLKEKSKYRDMMGNETKKVFEEL